jgi:hypothetical protein
MLLPGTIELWTLGDVLGPLLRAGVSGVLELTVTDGRDEGTEHRVHLRAGSPAAVVSPGPRLGEFLVAGGVDEDAIDLAAEKQREGDRRLFGELLADLVGPGPSRDLITTAMRAQTRARLDRLFRAGRARLRFRTLPFAGERALRAATTSPALDPEEFLHGRPRSRDRRAESARADALRALGLGPEAPRAAVRQMYRQRVLELHPDRATSEVDRLDRTRALARVTAAYQLITTEA